MIPNAIKCGQNVYSMKKKVFLTGAALCLLHSMAVAGPKVPISFDKYHGYTGTVDFLKAVCKAYPDITELQEIGRSSQNRPMYVLAITNKKTGTTLDREKKLVHERKLEVPNPPITDLDLGKAAYMITGCTHGNEMTGNEVCLYFIDKVVSGYGTDKEITDMVNNKVLYVCPAINPDGLYNTVELGATQRTNSMYQEEKVERKDLNGDGKWSQFRYKNPKGYYYIDPTDSRVMLRATKDTPEDQRYSVEWEAKNDKGIDMNRNFPEAWWNTKTLMPAGTGNYSTEAPEVQAMCEFFITHPNVYMVNEYHTQGGHVYRPLGSTDDKGIQPRDLAVYDKILGKKYQELMESEDLNSIWRRAWEPEGVYAGLLLDWLYKQCGVMSIATELWNPRHEIPSLKDLKGDDYQRGIVQYAATQKSFIDWTKGKHPEHGDVEIGGWLANVGPNNAYPGDALRTICERQWQFDRYCIGMMPQMSIENLSAKVQTSTGSTKIVEITADIVNTGALPSGLQNSENMAFNRGDVVWIIGNSGKVNVISGNVCEKLGNLYGTESIPGFRGENRKTIKWVVAVEGNENLKVVASSLKGGTVMQNVKY